MVIFIVFLLIFIILQIRIFTISEDNIYDKLIRDEMIKGNYSEAKCCKTNTNNNYADDETYYLSGLITATIVRKQRPYQNGKEV